jgi:hypothetical protein
MHRKVTLDQVREVLRTRACPHCRLRSPGRPGQQVDPRVPLDCEAGCELFNNLAGLVTLANQLDPLLGSYEAAIGHRVSQLVDSIRGPDGNARDGRSSPLNRHRHCVIETLSELVDGTPARRRRFPYPAISASDGRFRPGPMDAKFDDSYKG